jgi:hypothetical protein
VTAHCHAATAQLTREYQGDHRRKVLTPATSCAVHPNHTSPPLDNTFHIRSWAWVLQGTVGCCAAEVGSTQIRIFVE